MQIRERSAGMSDRRIRKRCLPAQQVVWLVLGMALYRGWNISRVVSHLHLALPGGSGRGVVPSAPVQACARLGDAPMRWLFERCGRTWAHQSADRHRYRGLALYGRRCGHLNQQTIARTSEGSPVALEE